MIYSKRMKIFWGVISIISTAVCFVLGSLYFSVFSFEYFRALLNRTNVTGFSLVKGLTPGVILYGFGVMAIFLLFKKSKVAYGYIISVIANILLLLVLSLIIFSPIFDFLIIKIDMQKGFICAVGYQQLSNREEYDPSSCKIDQNLKGYWDKKLPTPNQTIPSDLRQ